MEGDRTEPAWILNRPILNIALASFPRRRILCSVAVYRMVREKIKKKKERWKKRKEIGLCPWLRNNGSARIVETRPTLNLNDQNLRVLNRDKATSEPRSRMNTELVQGIYAKIKSRNDIMRNVGNHDKTDGYWSGRKRGIKRGRTNVFLADAHGPPQIARWNTGRDTE